MPYTDPEKRAAQQREWYLRNRDSHAAKGREWYLRNRDSADEKQRAWRVKNPERVRAYAAKYRAANRAQRRLRRSFAIHGMRPEDWARIWDAQDGRCYLCGCQLTADEAVVDHDHSCCPPNSSCRICRRGLSCGQCNSAIGLAGDDPARLRRMADALEAAQALVRQRKADAGPELTLFAVTVPPP